MPAPGVSTPAGAASATTSPGRCEHARESSRPERRRGHSSGRERSCSGGKRGRGRSPSPAHSTHSASVSASSSSGSPDTEERVNVMPPTPFGRSGIGGGRSGGYRSASGCASSPRPGPSGLGLSSGEQSAPRTDRSRSGFRGCSSPTPSGAAEDDWDSISGSVDLDRDSISGSVDLDRNDSFRTVLHHIQEFHSMEEPASVAPNRCKTSHALIYGHETLESSPPLYLPLSPLLRSLLEDTNLALSKFVEDQTVHEFLPVPGRHYQKYYRTSSSSFPGPHTVPPGFASITLDKVSE